LLCGFGQQWCDADATGEEVIHEASLEFAQLCRLSCSVLDAVVDLV